MKLHPTLFSLVLALAAVALAAPARAQTTTVYDQQYTSPANGSIGLSTGDSIGQSFTPTASAMDTAAFDLEATDNSSPPQDGSTVTCHVQILSGDGLGGSVLGQSSDVAMPAPTDGSATSFVLFRFPATVALTPGNSYTLVLTAASATDSQVFLYASGTSTDGYSGGQSYNGGGGIGDFDFQEGLSTPSITVLHAFSAVDGTGVNTDGKDPYGSLIQANDGNFYGTASEGGANADGTAFSVTADGTFQTLYDFTGGADGLRPSGTLLQGNDGNLYGTVSSGGTGGNGAVFQITPAGQGSGLYEFTGGGDGKGPSGPLFLGMDGSFYGTTQQGGTDPSGAGTVFKITADGVLTSLHSFNGTDGSHPRNGVIQALDGNFYGTTQQGGAHNHGTIFEMTPAGAVTTLYDFGTQAADGLSPNGLLQASDGNFYGTTTQGGAHGDGTIFRLSQDGQTFTTLYAFTDGADGAHSSAALIEGSDGNFYGTTADNPNGVRPGSIFELSADGTTLTSLYQFFGNASGYFPYGTLIQGSDGNLYGTALTGGAGGDGTLYRLNVALPDVVQFHVAINSVNEADGTAMVRVDRIGGSGQVAALYDFTDGTAKAGTDYTDPNAGTDELYWTAGDQTPKFIPVTILNRGFTDGSLHTLSITINTLFEGPDNTGFGYPRTATLTINGSIPGAPVIQSAATATGTTGQAFSYQIAASASPTRYGVTGLPMGLSVGRKSGLITGTPQVPGTFTLTLNAYNKAGQGSETLTLTVQDGPPDITSASTASYAIGSAFSYQITADHHPTSFGVTGLPAGLSVNAQTGAITGTPTTAGTDSLTLNAYNAAGKGAQTLTLSQTPPGVTSAATAQATQGGDFSYRITASGSPTLYGVYGLPDGITVDASTGIVSGQSKFSGTFLLTLNAYNSGGKGSQTLTLTVAPSLPAITSATADSATVGTAYSYQITATNVPTSYGVTGLPPGLSVDATTGLITGTPKKAGTYTLTLNAYNPAGKGSGTLTLTVSAGAP